MYHSLAIPVLSLGTAGSAQLYQLGLQGQPSSISWDCRASSVVSVGTAGPSQFYHLELQGQNSSIGWDCRVNPVV